ncbi:lytic transglycosylase domain-containing protein [Sulfurovum sp.]|uniref:lytic transglycosylase domain-containing protein n=1 Tax=Sulfurovum sp. TaxID=1969726 RepID=UPI0025DADBB8|nr:lytic transglycosylase domain-containing protein [Sulfurovum sp.]
MTLRPLWGVLLILAMGTTVLNAKLFTYWQVHNMPQSVEKDYYIWRFLSQTSTTAFQARSIIKEVDHLNKKLRTAYKKKTGFNAPQPSNPSVSCGTPTDWKRRSEANKYFRNAILLLQQNQLQKAADAFYNAHNTYEERWEKDKCLFWLYMVTEDRDYLDKLKKSYHINMYTLLAADLTNSKYPRTIVTPSIRKNRLYSIDAKNPIHWAKIKAKIFNTSTDLEDLADDCMSKETVGMYCYVKAKACNYKKSYFPMPYRKIMKKFPKERQALLYAIARQESRFVPASVSRSFALGMMQFMPFLVEHVAKKKGERIDLDDMFNPEKAIEYADFHLDYLNKYLYHPLFIAYAYNGGIGFTKRLIRQKNYFRKGAFEPYLSMEKMTNAEAREYGKRVLTNYVVYLNKLGKPTRLLPYIKMLSDPAKTDRFRK